MNDLTEKKSKGIGIRTIAQNGGTSFSLFLALVLAGIVFAIISPNHVFLKPRNFSNLLVNSSITSIMAAGCTVAMLLGGMDIAQYSVATLSRLRLHEASDIMTPSQRRGCHHGEITASA